MIKMLLALTISPTDYFSQVSSDLYEVLDKLCSRYIASPQYGCDGTHPHLHVLIDSHHTHDVFRRKFKESGAVFPMTSRNVRVERLKGQYGGYLFHENPKQVVRYKGKWDIATYREIGKKMNKIFLADQKAIQYVYVAHTKLPFLLSCYPDQVKMLTQDITDYKVSWNLQSFISLLLSLKINPTNNVRHYEEIIETTLALIHLDTDPSPEAIPEDDLEDDDLTT